MVAVYLLLSYLLSFSGFLLYKGYIQKKANLFQRKAFIYALVGMSLVLPIFIIPSIPDFQFEHVAHSIQPFATENTLQLEEELMMCYNLAITEQEFCKCEDLEQSGLLLYKEDPVFNSVIETKWSIAAIFIGIALLILAFLFAKVLSLVRIIRNSESQKKVIDGKAYYVLAYKGSLLAASFRLIRRYIVWKPELASLSPLERKAVMMHEVAHLKHLDTWELIGLDILQTIWFLNPVFYFLKKELGLLNEFMADAYAVQKMGNKAAYASLLIKLKEQQQFGALSHFGSSSLKLRVLQLIEPQESRLKKLTPFLVGLGCFLLTTGFIIAPPIHQQKQAFEQYQYIQKQYMQTGKTYFCKSCLYNELEACSF